MRIYWILLLLLPCFSNAQLLLNVVTEEWVPYNFTNEKGEIVGRATKKVREVLDAADVQYEIRSYPWARSMKLAQSNKNTMIYSIYRTQERENLFQWACPLLNPVKEYLFKLRTRDDIHIESLEDAKKYTISLVRGSVSHEYLLEMGFKNGVNLDLTADPSASPRKLLARRADFIITTEYTAYERMRELGHPYELLEAVHEVKNANERRACMAFSKDTNAKLVSRIRKALAEHNTRFIGP
ncbi:MULTISPECIES: substrate-binding periplasmic protein [Pseudoalteromonas]|uniref:ABC transporter substrate-binding protein n=1 Tax=Pseudoalteromonas amylolytica TaxID=1859457 RepID=A0A1S1MYY7_9GAMM|nr:MULTISPECIES: transporter substrate-binding domain-containing protein [Pseudoalteromonas]MCF6437140.1 transporter substrate-binding domain-containing protein [Pseudoalteromonas sp. MMG022]OHU90211.1 ABC transporter substrate-binding protein [Pseudoalteromonas sp. JW3]OHU92422.1 ABC transporter substrate-binding protein [Pseudoalteromonas amylolytica]